MPVLDQCACCGGEYSILALLHGICPNCDACPRDWCWSRFSGRTDDDTPREPEPEPQPEPMMHCYVYANGRIIAQYTAGKAEADAWMWGVAAGFRASGCTIQHGSNTHHGYTQFGKPVCVFGIAK